MKTRISIFLVCFFLSLAAFPEEKEHINKKENNIETVNVSGIVTDEVTGEALTGVEVILEGINKKCYTDFDGEFLFNDVTSGKYNITLRYISYKKQTIAEQNIDIFSSKLNVKLKPES